MFILICITVMAALSLQAIRNTYYSTKFTQGFISRQRAFENAQAGLFEASQRLSFTADIGLLQSSTGYSYWRRHFLLDLWESSTVVKKCTHLRASGQFDCLYLIEQLAPIDDAKVYRVTARGKGLRGRTVVLLQAVYLVSTVNRERVSWLQII